MLSSLSSSSSSSLFTKVRFVVHILIHNVVFVFVFFPLIYSFRQPSHRNRPLLWNNINEHRVTISLCWPITVSVVVVSVECVLFFIFCCVSFRQRSSLWLRQGDGTETVHLRSSIFRLCHGPGCGLDDAGPELRIASKSDPFTWSNQAVTFGSSLRLTLFVHACHTYTHRRSHPLRQPADRLTNKSTCWGWPFNNFINVTHIGAY